MYFLNVNFLFAEGEGAAGQPSICQNGGTYKTIQGTCECEPDYTGPNCETGQLRPFFKSYNKVKILPSFVKKKNKCSNYLFKCEFLLRSEARLS